MADTSATPAWEIRPAKAGDLEAIQSVHRAAFSAEENEIIVSLVAAILEDSTAEPTTSLVAAIEGRVVGHILFSTARLEPEQEVKAAILAPLAVLPEVQSKGIGGQLIRAGLQALEAQGTALVFVLGHPTYYPKHGFKPAGALGFEATYPIEEKNADAWMVQALAGASPSARGRVQCCAALDRKELWAE
ncbi:yjhQ [Symbiodinium sp. CCMP2592]|nr:yjhQ [Symbiodinium sp. CCMP2592]